MLHASQQYQLGLSCQHPIDGYHLSALPSALLDLDLVWRWGVTHNSLDHTLCLMLIGLAMSKKVSATVKLDLCLWGGNCEAKCLRLCSHAKSYRVSFRFYPQTFCRLWPSCRYNRGKRFSILIVEINYMTQIKEKTGICKSVVIATVVAIRGVVKNGFHCIDIRKFTHNLRYMQDIKYRYKGLKLLSLLIIHLFHMHF